MYELTLGRGQHEQVGRLVTAGAILLTHIALLLALALLAARFQPTAAVPQAPPATAMDAPASAYERYSGPGSWLGRLP